MLSLTWMALTCDAGCFDIFTTEAYPCKQNWKVLQALTF